MQHQSESVAAEINRKFIPKYQGLNIKDLLCMHVYKRHHEAFHFYCNQDQNLFTMHINRLASQLYMQIIQIFGFL